MAKFGKTSKKRLETAHPQLQEIFNEVVKVIDCSVLEGHRGEELQNKYFNEGKSKVKFPDGRHNKLPSLAVDVTPYPVDWNDRERQTLFAGYVLGVASQMGLNVRWGGDWNKDFSVADNRFDDMPHFEIKL